MNQDNPRGDDPESVDATGETADLTPTSPRPPRSARRRIVPLVIALGSAAAVAVLVVNLLNGSLFFYDANEAVARRAELGTDRFTLLGSPIDGSIVQGFRGDDSVVAFTVAFDGIDVDVVHFGDPPDLFKAGVPVVLDGAWVHEIADVDGFTRSEFDGWHFSSDRMRVKHDNDYKNGDEFDERLDTATVEGQELATLDTSGE